jgi:hypothetical protein
VQLQELPRQLLVRLTREMWRGTTAAGAGAAAGGSSGGGGGGGGGATKLDGHVAFPAALTPAFFEDLGVRAPGAGAASSSSGVLDAGGGSEWHYRLVAVIVHHSSNARAGALAAGSGHYTCYGWLPLTPDGGIDSRGACVPAAGEWVHMDDACVTSVRVEEVLAAHAYMVAYERVEGSLAAAGVALQVASDAAFAAAYSRAGSTTRAHARYGCR